MVGGIEFSGMSMIVVIPPAAAAAVAVAKPSQSVRPGSLTWTWVSTRPGSSTSSSASWMTVRGTAEGRRSVRSSDAVTAVMRPSRMADLRRHDAGRGYYPARRMTGRRWARRRRLRRLGRHLGASIGNGAAAAGDARPAAVEAGQRRELWFGEGAAVQAAGQEAGQGADRGWLLLARPAERSA